MEAVRSAGLDNDTLIVWTSDNGAVQRNPVQGSNLPLGGWGYSTREGGQRIPCIARWPRHVAAGRTCRAMVTLMDWLPTFASLAGANLDAKRRIDGKDLGPLLSGRTTNSPHEAFYYYYGPKLQAVRAGRWKLFLPLEKRLVSLNGTTAASPAELYDLAVDIGETTNVVAKHPDVMKRLTALAEKARVSLGDVDRPGTEQRPGGRVDDPTPRIRAN